MARLTRRDALVAGGGILAFLAGCTGPNRSLPERPTGNWRFRAHNARNTGAADVQVPPRGTPAWDEGEAHVAAPLIADGTVYSVADEVTALDAKTGAERWRASLDESAEYTPALLDDLLVVPDGSRLVAFDRTDGTQQWTTSLSGSTSGPVTGTLGASVLVVPVGDERVIAVDTTSGEQHWHDSTYVSTQAAIADGTVYVAGYERNRNGGVLNAISATDGTRKWTVKIDDPDTAPVVSSTGILVSAGGTLAVHDLADGQRRRELGTFGTEISLPPAVSDGTAFVAGGDGSLVAVSLDDGSVTWEANVRITVDTGVTVGRETVVAAVTDIPGIVAFDREDGTRRWEHKIEGFDAAATTPPALAEGAVFYASNESSGVVALGDLPAEE